MRNLLKLFARETRAVAAVEFAIIVPFVMFLMLAEFDLYRYVMATQRTQIIAESVAEMFASAAPVKTGVTTSGDGLVSDWDINFYENSAYFLYPDILTAAQAAGVQWFQYLQVDVAEIKMTPSGTSYVPKTYWHSSNANGATNRQCNTTYSLVADASVSSPTTLPQDVIGPNSIIAVDIRMTWSPTFGASWLPSIGISRSVFMSPRNVPDVEYSGTGWMGTNCS